MCNLGGSFNLAVLTDSALAVDPKPEISASSGKGSMYQPVKCVVSEAVRRGLKCNCWLGGFGQTRHRRRGMMVCLSQELLLLSALSLALRIHWPSCIKPAIPHLQSGSCPSTFSHNSKSPVLYTLFSSNSTHSQTINHQHVFPLLCRGHPCR
jgi:hypothetical protein